jgi:site-specific recombinase XerC
MDKFNSELEAVEENSVSLTRRQASFRGKGCTIGSVSISEEHSDEVKSWIPAQKHYREDD